MVAEAEAIPERNNRSLHIQSCLGKEGTRTGFVLIPIGMGLGVPYNHHTIERRSLLVRNSFCRTQCGSPSWRRGPVRLVVRDAMSRTGLCLYLILMLLASYVE